MVKPVLLICAIILLVSASGSVEITGDLIDLDPNSLESQQIAVFAVKAQDDRTNCGTHALVRVLKAQKQMENVTVYFLTIETVKTNCFTTYTNYTKIYEESTTCKPDPSQPAHECRVIVSGGPVYDPNRVISYDCDNAISYCGSIIEKTLPIGSLEPAHRHSAKIHKIAAFAIKTEDERMNCSYKHALLHVLKAQKQLVAGTNYFLTIEIARSNCKNGEEYFPCEPALNQVVNQCTLEVYEGLRKPRELIKYSCNFSQCEDPMTTGAKYTSDPNDPEVQKIAKFATSKLGKLAKPNIYQLLKVIDVQQQIVSGVLYSLNLKIRETCTNRLFCSGPQHSFRVIICSAKVLDKGDWRRFLPQGCYVPVSSSTDPL